MSVFGPPCERKSLQLANKPPPRPFTGEPFDKYKQGSAARGVTLSGRHEYRLANSAHAVPLVVDSETTNKHPYAPPSKTHVAVQLERERERENRAAHFQIILTRPPP